MGAAEVAQSLGLRHLPSVALNEFGTPLLNDVFASASKESAGELVCYVNSDIILLPDFFKALMRIKQRRFLGIGQRWDLDIDRDVDFSDPRWAADLRELARSRGELHPPGGSDFFLFPRSLFATLPPFAVGRPGWDNWLIYHARCRRVPVVDMTAVVTPIHQNHDYSHIAASVSGGRDYDGEEAERNRALVGGWEKAFVLHDATHLLTHHGLVPALSRNHFRRRWATLPVLHPAASPLAKLAIRMRMLLSDLLSVLTLRHTKREL